VEQGRARQGRAGQGRAGQQSSRASGSLEVRGQRTRASIYREFRRLSRELLSSAVFIFIGEVGAVASPPTFAPFPRYPESAPWPLRAPATLGALSRVKVLAWADRRMALGHGPLPRPIVAPGHAIDGAAEIPAESSGVGALLLLPSRRPPTPSQAASPCHPSPPAPVTAYFNIMPGYRVKMLFISLVCSPHWLYRVLRDDFHVTCICEKTMALKVLSSS
jgi:hypothetical protein